MPKLFLVLMVIIAGCSMLQSCKHEKPLDGSDKKLFEMAQTTYGFIWFKNAESLLDRSSGSGHSHALLRTRYNTIAAQHLGEDGLILPNTAFGEGSVIVKELYENSNTLSRYAVLYKSSGNEDADSNGWVWGYINVDGTVAVSATDKGAACMSCHSQSENIDYMLMNKFFP